MPMESEMVERGAWLWWLRHAAARYGWELEDSRTSGAGDGAGGEKLQTPNSKHQRHCKFQKPRHEKMNQEMAATTIKLQGLEEFQIPKAISKQAPEPGARSRKQMEKLIRRIDLARARGEDARQLLRREWLATNGLGGYASGTISGSVTWRYHGLLIAALPAPFGRMVMLNHLAEFLRLPDGTLVEFGGREHEHEPPSGVLYLREVRLENQLPYWRYDIEGITLEKRLLFLH